MIRTRGFIILVISLAAPAIQGEEAHWYYIELESGETLTARFLLEDDEAYVLNFEGSPLYIEKEKIKKIERLRKTMESATMSAILSGSGKASGKEDLQKEELELEEKFRDAVEDLSSTDNDTAHQAYLLLSQHFPASRRIVHEALRHPDARTRRLSVKLLGERGTAEEDLKEVAKVLNDSRASVRLAAIMTIRALGPEGLPEMVRCMNTESQRNLRKMAVKTFQIWRDPSGVVPLVDRLRREPDEGVRAFIAFSLEVLTKKKFGQDAEAWASYLEEEERRRQMEQLTESPLLRETRAEEPIEGDEE